jgi:hypothetical protein
LAAVDTDAFADHVCPPFVEREKYTRCGARRDELAFHST